MLHIDAGLDGGDAPAPRRPVVPPAPSPTPVPIRSPWSWGSALPWVSTAILAVVLAWPHVADLIHHGPAPIPVPPTPAPFAGKVEAVLILPDEPDNAQAKLQVTPRDELKGLNVNYRSYVTSAGALKNDAIQAEIKKAGPPPLVLWYEDDRFFEATSKPTVETILKKAREIRGK